MPTVSALLPISLRPWAVSVGGTLVAVLLASATACQSPPPAPPAEAVPPPAEVVADAAAGKAYWEAQTTFCVECHGTKAEGGYGPDLAGRRLSVEQFKRQVRQPWGAMPRWTAEQISDQTLADVHAYLTNLPRVDTPGAWKVTAPRDASPALRYFTESYGCAQCHGLDMVAVLTGADDPGMNYEWFATRVYTHDKAFPTGKMGSFSPVRLPEAVLRVMWESAFGPDGATRVAAPGGAAKSPPAAGGTF